MPDENKTSSSESRKFATTHWSVILSAGDTSSPQHEQALSELYQSYWYPLYAYLRRCGYDTHQAEDYTQSFFAQLLEKHSLHNVKPTPGKFRSFLLTAIRHFVADEHDHAKAIKRGGTTKKLSLDFEKAERQYDHSLANNMSPERLFERSWAMTMLQRTMNRLEVEFTSKNKQAYFTSLSTYIGGQKTDVPYHTLATELNMTEGAVKVAVHRLRKRYQELLRNEIAQTVAAEDQIDEEIRDLFIALAF